MYADTVVGRVEAAPGLVGTCPSCGGPVRPKCGRVVVHHWAHHARDDCDPWSEPMTEWHWRWQQSVPPDRREVVMGEHRADIVTASGGVVEVQHSPISPEGIETREAFYGERMAWIFDATEAFAAGRIDVESRRGGWDRIWWKHARRSLQACRRPVLLDLGNGIVLQLASAILVEAYGQRWWRPVLNMEGRGWCRPLTRQSVEAWLAVGGRWDVHRVPGGARP